eukprot:11273647-Alexandrium_andersonii.AAC.1
MECLPSKGGRVCRPQSRSRCLLGCSCIFRCNARSLMQRVRAGDVFEALVGVGRRSDRGLE